MASSHDGFRGNNNLIKDFLDNIKNLLKGQRAAARHERGHLASFEDNDQWTFEEQF